MQFLDAIGLASFWGKIKKWVNGNYLSLTGGTIRGSVSFLYEADGGKSIRIDPSNITNSNYGVNYLFASGKMIPIGEANGVAGLDSNGNVPLAQLGNLDTTVAEVVTALPTTNIKKHIYLIKDPKGVAQNLYEEYIYTGDTSATYDASKWEKLGNFRAIVDLADYAKKSEAMYSASVYHNVSNIHLEFDDINEESLATFDLEAVTGSTAGVMIPSDKNKLDLFDTSKVKNSIDVGMIITAPNGVIGITYNTDSLEISFGTGTGSPISFTLPAASARAGLMTAANKTKLDGIANNANNYSLPTASSTTKGGITLGYSQSGKNYPVALDGNGKAYVNVPWTDTNTTYDLSPYAKTADVNAALAKKVDVVSGKGLSTEDFTAALKTKLNGIATGATADSAIPISVIDALN